MDDILSVPLHRKCLSRACRSVHEYGTVLPIDEGVTQCLTFDLLKDALLRGLRIKNFLETVDLLILALGGGGSPLALPHNDLRLVAIDN